MERMRRKEIDSGLTTIAFGFNDAACRAFARKPRVGIDEYRANLIAMGEEVRARGGEPVFIIPHACNFTDEPTKPDGAYYTAKVAAYGEVCRAAAESIAAAVIDMPAEIAARGIAKEDWYVDGVHLNRQGNIHYGAIVFDTLKPLAEARA
jgi:lysophospholipase L1-like esterase